MTLIISEQENIRKFKLEGRTYWTMGRATAQNVPDIPLNSPIVGRQHGKFLLIDGELFYCDLGSVNGTFYNGKKIEAGIGKRICPVMLKSGDILQIDYRDLKRPDFRGVRILVISMPHCQVTNSIFGIQGQRSI